MHRVLQQRLFWLSAFSNPTLFGIFPILREIPFEKGESKLGKENEKLKKKSLFGFERKRKQNNKTTYINKDKRRRKERGMTLEKINK